MSRENQRYFIFASWKNGRNATQIHEELVNVEGEQALSISTIRCWIATFKDREEDKARSGRPREAVTSEKIARVEDLVSNDPHISTIELANEVGISRERISYILHEELNLHKLCTKWVPHRLSEEHKRNRVELSNYYKF